MNGALATYTPFRKTEQTELDRSFPSAQFLGIGMIIGEVIREFSVLYGSLQPLRYSMKKTTRPSELHQWVGGCGACVLYRKAVRLHRVTVRVDALLLAQFSS